MASGLWRGQRLSQAASDIFLGWTRIGGRDYYVRQLRDIEGSVPVEALSGEELQVYGRACGVALAAGHARSGDPVALAGYLGRAESFDRAIGRFAVAYADQTGLDHAVFARAMNRSLGKARSARRSRAVGCAPNKGKEVSQSGTAPSALCRSSRQGRGLAENAS